MPIRTGEYLKHQYHVQVNRCGCHPETCSCNDFVVIKPGGLRICAVMNRDDAHEIANALNVYHGIKPMPSKD